MLTLAELLALRDRLRSTRTLSVYASDLQEESVGPLAGVRTLAHVLHDLRDGAAVAPHAEREAIHATLQHLERLIESVTPRLRYGGLVSFITEDGVQYSEIVPGSVPTVAVWGVGISMAPALPLLDRLPPVTVAVADSTSVHLYARENGKLVLVEVLRAEANHETARHMGTPPKQRFHPGTRGTTAADASQRQRQVGREDLARRTVARLTQLDGDGIVLVGGSVRAASEIFVRLPNAWRSRAILLRGLDIHASVATITKHVDAVLADWRESSDREEVARITHEYLGTGQAAVGERQTLAALQRGAVEQLFISEPFLLQHLDSTESVLQLALAHRTEIACVRGAAAELLNVECGGLAARLRFVPAPQAGEAEGVTASM